MRRLALIVITLLLVGGTVAWADAPAPPSPVIIPALVPNDTIVDYGQLVGVTGTPEVCGLSRAPTRVRIQDKTWTRQEMSPVIFCWASKTGKPVVGTQVAMTYWIRGRTMVALTKWRKRSGMFFLYPKSIWMARSPDWGTVHSLDLQEVPFSADQLAGKIGKRTTDTQGRWIAPRDTQQQFRCAVQPQPVVINCGRLGTWDGLSAALWLQSPWRTQDVVVFYDWPPSCGCKSVVAYDPSGISGG